VLSSLESHILPLVPGLSDQLARGIRVLDVGCGRGRIALQLVVQHDSLDTRATTLQARRRVLVPSDPLDFHLHAQLNHTFRRQSEECRGTNGIP
jgi:SAM-dependent methyltransferase